jgi:hypothetical protein
MSKQHKWHKEIKAWADGAEIEEFDWEVTGKDGWYVTELPEWNNARYKYRIKPQPKEPQYLYVWSNNLDTIKLSELEPHPLKEYASLNWKCLGKIKLEVDDD